MFREPAGLGSEMVDDDMVLAQKIYEIYPT